MIPGSATPTALLKQAPAIPERDNELEADTDGVICGVDEIHVATEDDAEQDTLGLAEPEARETLYLVLVAWTHAAKPGIPIIPSE